MSSFARRLAFTVVVMLVAVGAASGGAMMWRSMQPEPAQVVAAAANSPSPAPASVAVGDRRPDLSLLDLDGKRRSISEWDGSLLVVNFWATWCPPCLEEIPTFVKLQERFADKGLVFLGIALDSPERVRAFMSAHDVNYESLHGEKDAIDATRAFGNRYGGLPFTAMVGRDGRIVHLQQGILDEVTVLRLIDEHL